MKMADDFERVENNLGYRPHLFLRNSPQDMEAFQNQCQIQPIRLEDQNFVSQLKELVKIRNPHLQSPRELTSAFDDFMNQIDIDLWGTWVLFPWLQSAFLLLSEKEFLEVRTARNKLKITDEEQQRLAKCTVSIAGLSVGASIAHTLAMERVCGHFVLADFDSIELSNLNRLDLSVADLGENKAVITARKLYELDPYLKVDCITEGVSSENVEEFFFREGRKIDVVIDECDDVPVKILLRQTAKKHRVPLIMETNDRGMVDVERYDDDQEYPILHGYLEGLDFSNAANLSNEEKIPFLLPMVGVDTMSTRLKASAIEVGKSLSSWPQLGSDVVLGGAIVTKFVKRVLLGTGQKSGRFFFDFDLIFDTDSEAPKKEEQVIVDSFDWNKSYELANEYATEDSDRKNLELNFVEEIVRIASLAPSGGNAQPWRFFFHRQSLFVLNAEWSRETYLDFESSSSLIGIGACLENVFQFCWQKGLDARFTEFTEVQPLVGRFDFYDLQRPKSSSFTVKEIEERYTDRSLPLTGDFPELAIKQFSELADPSGGFRLIFQMNEEEKVRLGELVSLSDYLRIFDKITHQDFTRKEMRYPDENNQIFETGISIEDLQLSESQKAGLKLVRDFDVIEFLDEIDGGHVFKDYSKNLIAKSPLVISIVSTNAENTDYLEAGKLLQKLWLLSTRMNLGFQPFGVQAGFVERLLKGGFGEDFQKLELVKELKEGLYHALHIHETEYPLMLIRVFLKEDVEVRHKRLEVVDIMRSGEH